MRRRLQIALVALLCVLAAVVVWQILQPGPKAQLRELMADLRARGEPVTLAQCELPIPPPDDNGAHDLDAAIAWLDAQEWEQDWERTVAGPWNDVVAAPWDENATPEQMAALRALLASAAAFHAHLDRAAEQPAIAWPLPNRTSGATVMDSSVDVGDLQRLSSHLDARSRAAPTSEERVHAVRSTLAIGSRVRTLTLIEIAVASAIQRGGVQALRKGLESGRIDPAEARAPLDALLATEWDARYPAMLRSERAWMLDVLPYWIDGALPAGAFAPPPTLWDRISAQAEALFDVGRHGTATTPAQLIAWARDVDAQLAGAPTALETREAARRSSGEAVSMAAVCAMVRDRLVQTDALGRLARVALAAHEHRRVHGDWPGSTADLDPLFPGGVPEDPYAGEPFARERDGDVLILRATPWDGLANDEEEAIEGGFVWRLPPR